MVYLAHGMVAVLATVVLVFPSCSMSRDYTAHDDLRSTSPTSPLSDLTDTWASFNHIMQHSDFFQWQIHEDSASILESFVLTGLIDMV